MIDAASLFLQTNKQKLQDGILWTQRLCRIH